MSESHLVRVGVMGEMGPFRSTDIARYPRGARVILRTRRGLEIGEVLVSPFEFSGDELDGAILRRMTVEDELLDARLQKNRDEAFAACQQRLAELPSPPALVDVETLFDGRSLYFFFVGETGPEVEAIADELAALYDARLGIDEFQKTLAAGCGPDCGTEESAGSGCSATCISCSVSSACATSKK